MSIEVDPCIHVSIESDEIATAAMVQLVKDHPEMQYGGDVVMTMYSSHGDFEGYFKAEYFRLIDEALKK